MITNAREYQITRSQAEKFQNALNEARRAELPTGDAGVLRAAQLRAMESQLEELLADLRAYETLAEGRKTEFVADSLDQLPMALIQARIAAGMTQRDLAERLSLKEQQVQRYEASQYLSASLTRLIEVTNALGVRVQNVVRLTEQPTWSRLLARLKGVGLEPNFVRSRLVPVGVDVDDASPLGVHRAAELVSSVFGWTVDQIFGTEPLGLDPALAGGARFKSSAAANSDYTALYAIYAHRLALGAIKATPHLASKPIPTDPAQMRRLIEAHGAISFSSALRCAWDLGVVVIPLADRAAFHGAFWRIKGRNVVVLKQRTQSAARWLVDLLHELYHASQEPGSPSRTVVEASEFLGSEDPEERQAIAFSCDVVLNGQAETLFQEAVSEAKGDVPRLKSAVPRVARRHRVPADALANHVAWRLAHNGRYSHNWWGTANTLQSDNTTDLQEARSLCFERMTVGNQPDSDVELLFRALRDEGEP